MEETIPVMRDLPGRSWKFILGMLSTSTLSLVLFSVVIPIVVFVAASAYVWWTSGAHMPLTYVLKESLAPTLIGLVVTVVALAVLLGWGFVATIRRDYKSMRGTLSERDEQIARLVAENERLRQPAIGLALSEEDPIVNFDPLNSEFLSQGYVPFMLSNKGQRVNPAHGVTVLPIHCAPSVRFEYVDRVDANEEKRMVPIVDGFDLLPSNNILPELRKAWSDAHEAGGFDDAEFPFEITIQYRDAKRRTFQTTVSLRYCPLEEDAARRSVMSGQRQMAYAILKVTDSGVMRLS